ncbi:MAG: hypothetical protein AB1442_05015, partial [Nitrospirota bacterium]
MPEKLFEKLITVIGGRPYKFFVRLSEDSLSEEDFGRDIRYIYLFEGTGQSNPKENLRFTVKVTEEVVKFYPSDNDRDLHNEAIVYGLHSIGQNPHERVFYLTTDELERIKNIPFKDGLDLRKQVLTFVIAINSQWPDESVSYIDLQDNLIGIDKEGGKWLNHLCDEGLLERVSGFKKYSRARGRPDTIGFRIAPKARKEIDNEIAAEQAGIQFPENNFYKLIELEIERKGSFVFVIM